MRRTVLDLLQCPFTAGPFTLEALEGDGDDVEVGLLRSEAGTFPIVAGIPVLKLGQSDLVDLLRAGEHDRAARRAAFGEVPPAGSARIGSWLADTHRLRGMGTRAEARARERLDDRAAPLTDPATPVHDLFALAYRDLHLRNPEVFTYNSYRFGVPRHLAALACLEWAPRAGPVLDLGCGAGHLTWALARHVAPAPVIGVDGLYFALYVARHRLAPEADFVCCDLESLPLRDEAITGVWASDVFHALARKAAVARELDRVSDSPSWGAVIALAVAGHEHEYTGRPLSVAGYQGLLPSGATVEADEALVAGYLAGHAASHLEAGEVEGAASISALWADADLDTGDGAAFAEWPHGRGELIVNPLLVGDRHRTLTFPTPSYEREHGGLREYVPAEVDLPPLALDGARTPEIEDLVARFVLLGVPPGYGAARG